MKHPWANILLFGFVAVELATGFFGLLSGSPDRAVFILIHRIGGYGLVIVLVWKVGIVIFSLRNRKRSATTRTASLALMVLLAATLALGFAWSTAGPYYYRPPIGLNWSGVSWHAYVGALLFPLLVWHAVKYTSAFSLPWTFWVERRSFLRFAVLSVAGLALWRVAELGVRLGGLSGKDRRFTGSYQTTRAAGAFPVVSWLNDTPPRTDVKSWKLSVSGLVERSMRLDYSDLAPSDEMAATIDCTGGWYSDQVWRGVRVGRLLDDAGVMQGARSVTFVSATGYYRRYSVEDARRCLLATHVAGDVLSVGHGYPVRLVAPGKRGFEWVKWVDRIEVTARPNWLQPPLPLQ